MILDCKSEKTNFTYKSEGIAIYFNEIRKYPVLTSAEERKLLETIKNGSPIKANAARNKLIECNQRFVVSAAQKWQKNDNLMDLINEGNIGLMQAIDGFDLNKKQRFLTYAVYWIRKMINDYIIKREGIIRVNNATKVHTYISKARNSFYTKYQRMPNKWELKEELMDEFNIHISNADDLDTITMNSINICDDNQDEDNAAAGFSQLNEFNEYTSVNDVDDRIDEMHNSDLVKLLMARLDNREKYIVKSYFGIDCEEKGYDVIAKDLNVCKERVRQILRDALKKMNNSVTKGNYGKN